MGFVLDTSLPRMLTVHTPDVYRPIEGITHIPCPVNDVFSAAVCPSNLHLLDHKIGREWTSFVLQGGCSVISVVRHSDLALINSNQLTSEDSAPINRVGTHMANGVLEQIRDISLPVNPVKGRQGGSLFELISHCFPKLHEMQTNFFFDSQLPFLKLSTILISRELRSNMVWLAGFNVQNQDVRIAVQNRYKNSWEVRQLALDTNLNIFMACITRLNKQFKRVKLLVGNSATKLIDDNTLTQLLTKNAGSSVLVGAAIRDLVAGFDKDSAAFTLCTLQDPLLTIGDRFKSLLSRLNLANRPKFKL